MWLNITSEFHTERLCRVDCDGFLRKRKRICWYDEWYNEAFGFRLVMQDEKLFYLKGMNIMYEQGFTKSEFC